MTGPRTSSPSRAPAAASYRSRALGVVLVAAWLGAFAVTSAPVAHASTAVGIAGVSAGA